MNNLKPCPCDLNLLNDRILNLGVGLATALKNVRRERRAAKDYLRQYQPIVKYIADNPDILKKLDRLVGELRRAEKPIEGRRYYPRALDVPIGRDDF